MSKIPFSRLTQEQKDHMHFLFHAESPEANAYLASIRALTQQPEHSSHYTWTSESELVVTGLERATGLIEHASDVPRLAVRMLSTQ
jgi:hypothetical protein